MAWGFFVQKVASLLQGGKNSDDQVHSFYDTWIIVILFNTTYTLSFEGLSSK